jgi:hypothetical protein
VQPASRRSVGTAAHRPLALSGSGPGACLRRWSRGSAIRAESRNGMEVFVRSEPARSASPGRERPSATFPVVCPACVLCLLACCLPAACLLLASEPAPAPSCLILASCFNYLLASCCFCLRASGCGYEGQHPQRPPMPWAS